MSAFSCRKTNNEVLDIKVFNINDSIVETIPQITSLLNQDIDVKEIKNQLDGVTTSFLSKEETIFYVDKVKNNFYGHYELIKNDNNGMPTKRVGQLVIYDSINPYIYEKNTDEFIEITLNDKGISLFDGEIEVGISLLTLLEKFGNTYEKLDSNTIVFSEKSKQAFFKITTKDSLVSKIKIGIYRDSIDMKKMLKTSKW